jgi:hypothetical protein
MTTFSNLLIERNSATHEELEACIANQVLHGGHMGTSLVELGVIKENALQRLLGEYYELTVGPKGRLPHVTSDLEELLPKELAKRYHVYPVKRTRRALRVAITQPLDEDVEELLRKSIDLQLRLVVVTPLRLAEALHRWCDLPMSERQRWLLEMLNAGRVPTSEARQADARRRAVALFPAAPPYRRMSEHPDGIVQSSRQPAPSRPTALLESVVPDTLDGFGPAQARKPATLQPGEHGQTRDPGDSEMPASANEVGRITQPYVEDGEGPPDEGKDGKRDTQPWRDDGDEEEPPLSVGAFDRSLSQAPPSAEEKIHEEHRRFRHRGPFTRAQAEMAVSQAPDVVMVMEIMMLYSRQFFERSVLFVINNDKAALRFAHGLGIEHASFTVALDSPSVLGGAYRSGDPVVSELAYEGVDATIREALHTQADARVAVVPLSIRERVVAMFYGDDRTEGVDRSAVADVTDFTEICSAEITRLIIERKKAGL